MDPLSPTSAADFLEQHAGQLRGASSLKWTGEFGSVSKAEARLLRIATALRQSAAGSAPGLGEDDARFLREQAESLRSPNRMTLGDPMDTAEHRRVSEDTYRAAEQLEDIADLIMRPR